MPSTLQDAIRELTESGLIDRCQVIQVGDTRIELKPESTTRRDDPPTQRRSYQDVLDEIQALLPGAQFPQVSQ